MREVTLGPWPLGLDVRAPFGQAAPSTLRVADNVQVTPDGSLLSLCLPRLIVSGRYDSLHPMPDRQHLLARQGATLGLLDGALQFTPLVTVQPTGMLSYTDDDEAVVAAHRAGRWRITSHGTVESWSIPAPPRPAITALDGGLDAGSYGVAVSWLLGQRESALSPAAFITVPQDGGMAVVVPTVAPDEVTGLRLYRTATHGLTLFQAVDVPLGIGTVVLQERRMRQPARTQYWQPLPGGDLQTRWGGRWFTAFGKTISYTQPFDPALYDPRFDWLDMPGRVTLLEAVDTGIFVGTHEAVWFWRQPGGADMALSLVSSAGAIMGTGLVIPTTEFPTELALGGTAAVWMTHRGYAVGRIDGSVLYPQSTRLEIQPFERGFTFYHGGRLVTLAH